MGYALKNSAILAAKHRLKIPAVINPQITIEIVSKTNIWTYHPIPKRNQNGLPAEDPPEGSAKFKEAARAVHEF